MSGRTIGQLAREACVNVETIRYYQRRGLIPQPQAVDGRWRHYGDEAFFLLRFIKLMQRLGFSLREIQALLAHFPTRKRFVNLPGKPPSPRSFNCKRTSADSRRFEMS